MKVQFQMTPRGGEYLERTAAFIRKEIEPREQSYWSEVAAAAAGPNWRNWRAPALLGELRSKARRQGLWNMFFSHERLGAGLSNQDYAHIAEQMGRSLLAPEVFNCGAPDSGNMELLGRYGSKDQKLNWLTPLLSGAVRSVFCMTEPDAASSDATNMQATLQFDEDEFVLNGKKWWASGVGDPRAKLAIVMAKNAIPAKDKRRQHSIVLVPLDEPGVRIERMHSVLGSFDAPHGHGEVSFENVRLPLEAVIGKRGMGLEMVQGLLGPGRIRHCMRCIGAAEKSLELMIDRGLSRVSLGKPIIDLGGNRERVAEARIAIDQARLLTLHAAWKIDTAGAAAAITELSAIKIAAPNTLQFVADMAIQLHGAMGLSSDTPLAGFLAQARGLRIADGPDEGHKRVISEIEIAKRINSKTRAAVLLS